MPDIITKCDHYYHKKCLNRLYIHKKACEKDNIEYLDKFIMKCIICEEEILSCKELVRPALDRTSSKKRKYT